MEILTMLGGDVWSGRQMRSSRLKAIHRGHVDDSASTITNSQVPDQSQPSIT